MAMTMTGEIQLAAEREVVWAKLIDPEILRSCIPGCEELDRIEDGSFRGVAKMKIGPVSARFKGRVILKDLTPLTATTSPAKVRVASPDLRRVSQRFVLLKGMAEHY
jgi:carbon monoxide dehydrogenase subunit G